MTSALEGAEQAGGQFNSTLLAGLNFLSAAAEIPFVQYVRYVLPLDGYVFWLRTKQTMIAGSLHYPADKQQREDETLSISRVIFTTGTRIQQFNDIAPNTIWIGEAAGLRFAFSRQDPFYDQSGVYHYRGDAVYPALESQLVDVGSQLSTDTLIVSNSLPAWLALPSYNPVWLVAPNPGVKLYPSFLVPDNLRPPYGVVHIAPDQTENIGAFPVIGLRSAHTQLASDRVRITLYGLTNAQALAFQDLIYQYSQDTNVIGIMQQTGIVRDEKRTQPELSMLAMKKTITLQVSYLQASILNVARQLIEKATATMLPELFIGA